MPQNQTEPGPRLVVSAPRRERSGETAATSAPGAAQRLRPVRDGGFTPPSRKPHPDHHLWRNGRLWWVAFTVHLPGWRKERVRVSLGTADLAEARRRRDELLRSYPEAVGGALSLRFDERRGRRMAS